MNKQKLLDKIAEEIRSCEECKAGKSGMAVPGEGNADADIVFVGEAPGKNEAMTGRPFVGRSGKFLRSLITDVLKLKEEDVFITSPVKYLPDRGTPAPADIAHGRTHFLKQLEIIEPKIIVLLGSVATQGVLGEKYPTTKMHGQILNQDGRNYFFTFHPAAGIRFAKIKVLINEDFKKLKTMIDTNFPI